MGRRSFAGLQLAAVAAASVLLGHSAAYVAAVPNAGLRDTILLNSGHAYWMLGVKLALVLGGAALAASGMDALRRGIGRLDAPDGWRFSHALVALVLIQTAGFTLLEVSERILVGLPVGEMLQHDLFAWGIAVQLLIAPLGALALAWLGRALRRIVEHVRGRPFTAPRATQQFLPTSPARVPAPVWRAPVCVRGPPVAARHLV